MSTVVVLSLMMLAASDVGEPNLARADQVGIASVLDYVDAVEFVDESTSDSANASSPMLRLGQDYRKPLPLTWGQGFLDPDPVSPHWQWQWPKGGYVWNPTLTVAGVYSIFATAFEEQSFSPFADQTVGIGHQMLIDIDYSVGGTERIHAQFRPLGIRNSGGSFLMLNEDVDYIDNSTALPQRLWFEGDISQMLSGIIPETIPADVGLTAGLYPYYLQNGLLINDDIVGVMLSKNSWSGGPFSHVMGQLFFAFDEIDSLAGPEDDNRMIGAHGEVQWGNQYLEGSYAHVWNTGDASRNQDFLAFSVTKFCADWTFTGRFLSNMGDDGGDGSGQLYVFESNVVRELARQPLGLTSAVTYVNLFWATEGWNPISGGNFDRLRSTFAVNPLVPLTLDSTGLETRGLAIGSVFFSRTKDFSLVPEASVEWIEQDAVVGLGGRARYRIGRRHQVQLRGIGSITGTDALRRNGLFLEWFIFF